MDTWRLFEVLCEHLKGCGCRPHLKISHTVQRVQGHAGTVASIVREEEPKASKNFYYASRFSDPYLHAEEESGD